MSSDLPSVNYIYMLTVRTITTEQKAMTHASSKPLFSSSTHVCRGHWTFLSLALGQIDGLFVSTITTELEET